MRLVSKISVVLILLLIPISISAQTAKPRKPVARKFGPNVQAYLDYLQSELTVTDLPASRREIDPEYVRHNYNRVSALRQFAIRLAGESEVDYVPEMEAVAEREFRLLFPDDQPATTDLKAGEIYSSYRYLGTARYRETFYIFARLDPFEEEAQKATAQESQNAANARQTEETNAPKIGAKPAVTIETKEETPNLPRARVLYGVGDKPKTAPKQPNR